MKRSREEGYMGSQLKRPVVSSRGEPSEQRMRTSYKLAELGSPHLLSAAVASKAVDCCQYHPAKDGDGWVEYRCPLVYAVPPKAEIPRAFVWAESKIFDVSEWAICQLRGIPYFQFSSLLIQPKGMEEYEDRAVELAENRPRLLALTNKLKAARLVLYLT